MPKVCQLVVDWSSLCAVASWTMCWKNRVIVSHRLLLYFDEEHRTDLILVGVFRCVKRLFVSGWWHIRLLFKPFPDSQNKTDKFRFLDSRWIVGCIVADWWILCDWMLLQAASENYSKYNELKLEIDSRVMAEAEARSVNAIYYVCFCFFVFLSYLQYLVFWLFCFDTVKWCMVCKIVASAGITF